MHKKIQKIQKRTIALISLTVLASFLALAAAPQQSKPKGAAQAQQPPFKTVATVRQLMDAIIIPSSTSVFNVLSKDLDKEEEWDAVKHAALALAEAGNLLMIGERAKDKGPWIKASEALIDAGSKAFQAAETKNVDAIMEAGDQVLAACEGCHARYLPKAEGQ